MESATKNCSHNKRMSICIVSPAAYPLLSKDINIRSAGGAEAQFVSLAVQLVSIGYKIIFIVDDYGQDECVVINGITVYKTTFRYLGGNNYYLPADWLKLIMVLKKIDAEIYMLKVPKDILLPIGIAGFAFSKKIIYVGQSDKDVDFHILRKLQNRLAVIFYRLGLMLTSFAVAQTKKQHYGFMSLGLDSEIIPNMLTLPDHSEKERGWVLWVGNATINKQPEIFLRLARELPNYIFKMILSGDKAESRYIELFSSAKEIPNLEFIGFVPFENINEYFAKASLLVSTSIYEGYPNVFLQAWQHYTPVVSLMVDPDDVIKNNKLGVVSKTEEGLVRDIEYLMSNEHERMKIGNNSRRYVLDHHSPSKIALLYNKVFNQQNIN